MSAGSFGNLLAENLNGTSNTTKVRDNLGLLCLCGHANSSCAVVLTVESVDPSDLNDILFPVKDTVSSIDKDFKDNSSASILIPAMVVKDRQNAGNFL